MCEDEGSARVGGLTEGAGGSSTPSDRGCSTSVAGGGSAAGAGSGSRAVAEGGSTSGAGGGSAAGAGSGSEAGRRVCLFGGSFDPVHGGHLAMARAALSGGGADRVVFLPAALSPFKQENPPLFSTGSRLLLLRRALCGQRGMELSTLDLELPPPSWTWRLTERWLQLHPHDELSWLMGMDQWNQLHRWARYELLVERLSFIVCRRNGESAVARPGVRVRFVTLSHPASSSAIRQALRSAAPIDGAMMPPDLARAAQALFWRSERFRLDNPPTPALEYRHMNPPAIAIDGPAASGKSTVARLVAERLGFTFINTGAMYRAVTWYLLQRGIDPADAAAVAAALPELPLAFGKKGACSCVLGEGRELVDELTAPETNNNVSTVASVPAVRAFLVEKQREYNSREAVVMEGRDIGTVVFPHTPFKYFVTASEEVRAARRAAQGLTDSIAERDRKDSRRACAPLVQAADAKLVDTSDMSIEQVVDLIAGDVLSRLAAH